jgi:hypothetical protein
MPLTDSNSPVYSEAKMDQLDKVLHYANLELFRRKLASTSDEEQRETLLKLLTAEEAKSPLQPIDE